MRFLCWCMIMTVKSGIYCIYFDGVDDKYYIGCSIDIEKRIKEHQNALIKDAHPNAHLQSTYNKYGQVVFEVLEECSIDKLHEREIFYINQFNSFKNGFNKTNGGDGGGFGEGNSQAKHTEEEYLSVLRLLAYTNNTFSKISEVTGISINIIKHISRQSTHSYLQKLDPEAYAVVTNKLNQRDNSAATKGISYPKIKSPKGQEYTVTNIHAFADEHGLQYQNLHKVLTGKRAVHKGWILA